MVKYAVKPIVLTVSGITKPVILSPEGEDFREPILENLKPFSWHGTTTVPSGFSPNKSSAIDEIVVSSSLCG